MTRDLNVKNVMYSDKAKLYFKNLRLYGVDPNFLKVMANYNQNNLPIAKSNAYEPYDPYEFLYTPEGYMTCTLSHYIARKFNILETDEK